ncbi:MAG: glycosyltransferase [Candidatus Omnitrophica bacterium]|nr:glycosyltransferase [Candidatus Omnitrophota bacterium]
MLQKKRAAFLFDDSEFYRVNLNCKGDACFGYVNIDEKRTKGRVFVSPMHRLPFPDNRVKLVFLDFETVSKNKNLDSIFLELSRILIPNGILTIDNIRANEEVLDRLSKAGFSWIFRNSQKYLPVAHFVYSQKERFVKRRYFYATHSDDKLILSKDGKGERVLLGQFDFGADRFNEIRLLNVLEYVCPDNMEGFLMALLKALRNGARLEILVKDEAFIEDGKSLSFFDKANLAQYLTEAGFLFENIELKGEDIYARVRKKPSVNFIKDRPKRICAIGQYMMVRYNQLGFDWDGVPRAMDELGYDYILLEGLRNMAYKELHNAMFSYKPDYIFLMLKETLPILFDISEDLKKIGAKTIFWFTDPDEPWDVDLKGVLDFMFLSNTGQIESYKKAFNIDNIYFMAQPCTPSIMHYCKLPEIYDIGFTGALSNVVLHNTRRQVLMDLSSKYNVAIRNNMRNNVSEFYSQSKIVFGASDFKYDLYTSNRIFVAMSCARAYLTNKFPGIEKLVKNRHHVLWFEDYSEMASIVDYYLKHDLERCRIGENAARLVHSKHTYKERLKNIFDIVDGKTESFYGFI